MKGMVELSRSMKDKILIEISRSMKCMIELSRSMKDKILIELLFVLFECQRRPIFVKAGDRLFSVIAQALAMDGLTRHDL